MIAGNRVGTGHREAVRLALVHELSACLANVVLLELKTPHRLVAVEVSDHEFPLRAERH